ncbi:MAG: hypothetical protein JOZ81_22245 [Chloroflexi bacterium]|nr:hypothetical protein [Chloroflexota bacterium]
MTIATWGRPGQVAWPGTFVRDFGPLVLSAAFGAIGFTPVGALALTIFGLWSLSVGTVVMIVPGAITALVLGFTFPKYGRFALEGLAAGLVAVFVYDLVRWTFVGLGWWGDCIPNIGGWLNGTSEPDWVLGYTFRWLGDGGGMGVAFMVAARVLVPSLSMRSSLLVGVTYGLAIWLCLLMTLVAAPLGQTLLFPLTPVTFVLSCIGHIVYGAVLGYALGSIRLATRPYLWIMRQA